MATTAPALNRCCRVRVGVRVLALLVVNFTWSCGPWPAAALAAGPFAAEVVAAEGPFGRAPYDEPASVLGMPSTDFYDPWSAWSGGTPTRRVKLVEAPYNLDATQTRPLLTTLEEGSAIVVRFDPPIVDDPAHPYGLDLLVFGNAAYTSAGVVNDGTDLGTLRLTGTGLSEPVKVSVSPGYSGRPGEDASDWRTWEWYRYEDGPYGDTAFPTQAWRWDRERAAWLDELMDFTKPVNPALAAVIEAGAGTGLTAADAVALYDGSGGGTGFDLAASGFPSVAYVRVEGLAGFDGGEIDAFAAVRSMVLGDSLTVAPANPAGTRTTLRFQQPGRPEEPAVGLDFVAVSGVARVATLPLAGAPVPAPSRGRLLTAAQLELTPVPGGDAVEFEAEVRLFAGRDYAGDGSDLDLLGWEGTHWSRAPFTFEAATRSAVVAGVRRLTALALVQEEAPRLAIRLDASGVAVQFQPVPGWSHTLERTTDLDGWIKMASTTPTGIEPVTLADPAPPGGHALYRLRLARPQPQRLR